MDARLQTMERLFQALGDTTRLRILGLLPGVQRDAQRLQRKNGCCVPATAVNPAFACCATTEARS